MSAYTERSGWSPENVESIENIDKEVQLVSTSSESCPASNFSKDNGSAENSKGASLSKENTTENQNDQKFHSFEQIQPSNAKKNPKTKLHSSCNDLHLWLEDTTIQNHSGAENMIICRSQTFASLKNSKKTGAQKYDHVQSKVKHYFKDSVIKPKTVTNKRPVISEEKDTKDKEEYLVEINKQLTKELDEKNAILSLLQENYEQLLFKYAEAQNRIDELRFKVMTDNTDHNNYSCQFRDNFEDQYPPQFHYNEDYLNKRLDSKSQRVVVPPVIKTDDSFFQHESNNIDPPICRPSSLPLDNNLKVVDRDLIMGKATTPTDSEGLSSIITSMSGHSKILNSLDEENQINKRSNLLSYPKASNFILEGNTLMSDSFAKVKNWQNSLPPLEQIETPETALYNVCPNSERIYSSGGTKYKEIPSPKWETDFYLDESCPASWREDNEEYCTNEPIATDINQSSLLSLPNTSAKPNKMCQIHSKNPHHSGEAFPNEGRTFAKNRLDCGEKAPVPEQDVPSGCILQKRKTRPPLLRCSSLPAYDCDSIKSGNFKNGIYIPPLEIGNVTLSDEESYCQQDYCFDQSGRSKESSCVTSRGGSIDRSIQTPLSFSSCKATISEENFFSRVPRQTVSKSTSITPERSKAAELFFKSKQERSRGYSSPSTCIKECSECCRDKQQNLCNICGESILENGSGSFSRNKSNSCESVHNTYLSRNSNPNIDRTKSKPSFKRSVSFGSDSNSPKYFSHEEEQSRNICEIPGPDSIESFDFYTNKLKARSQAVMKALTAHVKNS